MKTLIRLSLFSIIVLFGCIDDNSLSTEYTSLHKSLDFEFSLSARYSEDYSKMIKNVSLNSYGYQPKIVEINTETSGRMDTPCYVNFVNPGTVTNIEIVQEPNGDSCIAVQWSGGQAHLACYNNGELIGYWCYN